MREGDLIDQRHKTEWARAPGWPSKSRFWLTVAVTVLTAGLVVGPPVPAPAGPLDGWSSKNVEFVRNISLPNAGGGRLLGRYFYVRSSNALHIFDVSDPLEPRQVSELIVPGGQFAFENPDTNGRILLLSQYSLLDPVADYLAGQRTAAGTLNVVDITDKSNPRILSQLPGGADHTISCILNCRWAYGGLSGQIIDLRDPAAPKLMDRKWSDGLAVFNPFPVSAHDVTEVAPGIVLTASVPMYLLDARNPVHPRVLARSDGSPYSYGGVAWPNGGKDSFVLSFSEPNLTAPNCALRDRLRGTSFDSAFKTWDASHWRQTGLFNGGDDWVSRDGSYVDGDPPGGPPLYGGCGALWFDAHPDFHNGGFVAAAHSGNGVKFLRVSAKGKIRQVGYWLPVHLTGTLGAYWITDEIVYSTDHDRGIDILRFTGGSE